jgi:hypothetical protein
VKNPYLKMLDDLFYVQIDQVPYVPDISLMHMADAKLVTEQRLKVAPQSSSSSLDQLTNIMSEKVSVATRGVKRKSVSKTDSSPQSKFNAHVCTTKTNWSAQVELILARDFLEKKKGKH